MDFFAKYVATNELMIFLESELNFLLGQPITKHEQKESEHDLSGNSHEVKWTGDDITFIKLIYALFHSKQINDGKGEITKVRDYLEKIFEVKISDNLLAKNINDCDNYSYNHYKFIDVIKDGYTTYLENPKLKRNK